MSPELLVAIVVATIAAIPGIYAAVNQRRQQVAVERRAVQAGERTAHVAWAEYAEEMKSRLDDCEAKTDDMGRKTEDMLAELAHCRAELMQVRREVQETKQRIEDTL